MLGDAVWVLPFNGKKVKPMKTINLIILAVAAASCAALVSCGSNAPVESTYIEPSK
jgi:hypothetical protein